MFKSLSHNQTGVFIAGILVAALYVFLLSFYPSSIYQFFTLISVVLVIKMFVVLTLIERECSYPMAISFGISLLFLVCSIIMYPFLGGFFPRSYSLYTQILFHILVILISTSLEGGILLGFFGGKISAKKTFEYLLGANILYSGLFFVLLPYFLNFQK